MARSVHVRLDDASEDALRLVKSASGASDSDAVRTALKEAAERRRSRSYLRAEVARIMSDPAEREEIRRVREFMDGLAAPIDPD